MVEEVVRQPLNAKKLKSVTTILPYPPLSDTQLSLLNELARRYAATRTQAVRTVVPDFPLRFIPSVEKRTVRRKSIKVKNISKLYRYLTKAKGSLVITGREMNPTDKAIADYIVTQANKGQVLCLFPDRYSLEWALHHFSAQQNRRPSIYHAGLSKSTLATTWKKIATGEAQIIFGTRTALFAPFASLCSILAFNASDDSYRSWDMQPHYDARELAMVVAKNKMPNFLFAVLPSFSITAGVPLVRVPATTLPKRVAFDRRALPYTERKKILPEELIKKIAAEDKPVLVFANKRGYAALVCRDCGYLPRCESCDRALVLKSKKTIATLHCERCNVNISTPETCPECTGASFHFVGAGVERIAEAIKNAFPTKTVQILSASNKQNVILASTLENIRRDTVDIIVATAVILPRLWTVPTFDLTIVLGAEGLFLQTDWQASERVLATLEQLSAHTSGELMVDTYGNEDPALKAFLAGTTADFYKQEIKLRKKFNYPPYGTILTLSGTSKELDTLAAVLKKGQLAIIEIILQREVGGAIKMIILKVSKEASLKPLFALLTSAIKVDVNPTTLL
ncbi:hypothetical protein COV04_02515 [Candidatus Uhrbacteria bacterium CG10_big_fil_rev_8_21_14_0_10_48_11]|uniref:Primosomal protein N n=1 Tax=Candidatus Uhrbacteria bacterium CG10_big_fil_rev_8_21_14_0_10_48_11 TaxID=1975037 RepID=A0A2M8LED0_9BACT|nr:MAG: hypothetical protein COV04_02515 [Candidatus Uhrbacteria bacterium CG10_big_fil_rev_8_21_14_0_10_48_11]